MGWSGEVSLHPASRPPAATVQAPCCFLTAPGDQECWLSSDRGPAQWAPSDLMRPAAEGPPACPPFRNPATWVLTRCRSNQARLVTWLATGLSRAARADARGGAVQALMVGWLSTTVSGSWGLPPGLADWPKPGGSPQPAAAAAPRSAPSRRSSGPPPGADRFSVREAVDAGFSCEVAKGSARYRHLGQGVAREIPAVLVQLPEQPLPVLCREAADHRQQILGELGIGHHHRLWPSTQR